MTKKRPFGTKRTLPSGRVQATYIGPDRKRHKAPHTFKNNQQAKSFLESVEAQIILGQWSASTVPGDTEGELFGNYCSRHIEVQANSKTGENLEESTKAHYRRLLATHLSPFSELRLTEISPSVVSDWWAEAAQSGHLTTLSKAYVLLKAVMSRAVEEGYIDKNPCLVKGAQNASTGKELYTPSKEELEDFLATINPRYRLLCLFMANGGLRFEEATALTRADLKTTERNGMKAFDIYVTKAVGWVGSDSYVKPPKSKAGVRTVRLHPELTEEVEQHLRSVGSGEKALLFPAQKSEKSMYLQHSVLNNNFRRAISRAGLPNSFSPHSLRRYFGSQYAKTGANWVEIGVALGDSSYEAIRRYVQPTGRDEELLRKMPPTLGIGK